MSRGMKQAGGEQVACVAEAMRCGGGSSAPGWQIGAEVGRPTARSRCHSRAVVVSYSRSGLAAPRRATSKTCSLSGTDMPALELRDIVSLHVA